MKIDFTLADLFVPVLALLHATQAAIDKEAYCAACHVVVNEIEHEISKVDPNKVLEVERFRVDPQGNQRGAKIPYARSETHLTEVLENVCEKMNKYADSTDKKTGKKMYKRTEPLPGQESVTLDNISISGESTQRLRNYCNNIIEDHDDDMITFLKTASEEPALKFCKEVAELCEEDDDESDEESSEKEEQADEKEGESSEEASSEKESNEEEEKDEL